MQKKYEFTEDRIGMLRRIKALVDIAEHGVKAGDLGGYLEREGNLDHKGSCWVGGNSIVLGIAHICGGALVKDYAVVGGHAIISGQATIKEFGHVHGHTIVGGRAVVGGKVGVWGHAVIRDGAILTGDCSIGGYNEIGGYGVWTE